MSHIPGSLLIVWDRLSAHRSKLTCDFNASQGERLWVEYLPCYAPELNPSNTFGRTGNSTLCPMSARRTTGLDETARRTLKRMRRRPRLITAFWQQAELWDRQSAS
jgi:hypothetical protein